MFPAGVLKPLMTATGVVPCFSDWRRLRAVHLLPETWMLEGFALRVCRRSGWAADDLYDSIPDILSEVLGGLELPNDKIAVRIKNLHGEFGFTVSDWFQSLLPSLALEDVTLALCADNIFLFGASDFPAPSGARAVEARLLRINKEFFTFFTEPLRQVLYRFIRNSLPFRANEADVQNIAQEAFLSILNFARKNEHVFSEHDMPLYKKIVYRRVADHFNKKSRDPDSLESAEATSAAGAHEERVVEDQPYPGNISGLAFSQLCEVAGASDEERQLLHEHYVQECTWAELAKSYKVSARALRTRVSRMFARFRKKLT